MPDILHRVGIDAKPAKVFAALTTLDGLVGWWVSEASGTPTTDGTIDFGFCKMKVLAAEPNQRVHWRCTGGPNEWLDTEVTFRLEWREGQTYVLFAHANWKNPVEFMHHCSTKWATFLLSLRDYVEHSAGRPHPNAVTIYVNEHM